MKRRSDNSAPPAEKRRRKAVILTNPVRITEDEADIVISLRRMREETTYPVEEVLRQNGFKLGR